MEQVENASSVKFNQDFGDLYSSMIKLRRLFAFSGSRMLPVLLENLGALTFHSVMGVETTGTTGSTNNGPVGPDGKKLKPCCACPETKRERDACIVEKGEENCIHLIEAHKACMRRMGFNI